MGDFIEDLKENGYLKEHGPDGTFKITSKEKIIFHFDGEPGNEMDEIEVKIVPLSLHVVC
jgi:diacylglycerol kinase family enzyme